MHEREDFNLEYTFHKKGWGYEKWLVNNDLYCAKILYFESNKRCSWHYHKIKTESFFVQTGKIIVRYSWEDDLKHSKDKLLIEGQSFHVPVGLRHMIIAIETANVLEVSTRHFEEDSYRLLRGD